MKDFKLSLKGSIGFIHAVTTFAQEWQKANDTEEGYEVTKDNHLDTAPSAPVTPLPQPEPPAKKETAAEKKARLKAEKEAEEQRLKDQAAAAPVVSPFPGAGQAPEGSVEDWLNGGQPVTDPNTVQAAQQATADPFATAPVAAQPAWVQPTQTVPWPGQAVQQLPLLGQITNIMQLLALDPAKRELASQWIAYKGAENLASLPSEHHAETLEVFNKIYSGEIK